MQQQVAWRGPQGREELKVKLHGQMSLWERSRQCEHEDLMSQRQLHVLQLSLRALRAQVPLTS